MNKTIRIDNELYDKWRKYCDDNCIHSKKLMSRLLTEAMKKHLESKKSFLRIRFKR